MKKFLQRLMLVGLGSTVILGCSAEEDGEEQMNSLNAVGETATVQTADISESDLLGTWNLVSMTSAGVAVNFDGDSVASTDILSETTCFHGMYFTFKTDGTVDTEQARLYFDETGNFTCNAKEYGAQYAVSGDILSITFNVKGNIYTENRSVSIENDGENDYLRMSLTGAETDLAVYVNDGRENTVAKDIERIDFLYIRK